MLYFGDTGRFPYGPKPADEVLKYALADRGPARRARREAARRRVQQRGGRRARAPAVDPRRPGHRRDRARTAGRAPGHPQRPGRRHRHRRDDRLGRVPAGRATGAGEPGRAHVRGVPRLRRVRRGRRRRLRPGARARRAAAGAGASRGHRHPRARLHALSVAGPYDRRRDGPRRGAGLERGRDRLRGARPARCPITLRQVCFLGIGVTAHLHDERRRRRRSGASAPGSSDRRSRWWRRGRGADGPRLLGFVRRTARRGVQRVPRPVGRDLDLARLRQRHVRPSAAAHRGRGPVGRRHHPRAPRPLRRRLRAPRPVALRHRARGPPGLRARGARRPPRDAGGQRLGQRVHMAVDRPTGSARASTASTSASRAPTTRPRRSRSR